MAREALSFLKYPALHSLAERQGVELGSSYKRNDGASHFIHYIAEAQRCDFLESVFVNMKFVSFLMDGSTDSGNKEYELVFVFVAQIMLMKKSSHVLDI